MQRAKFLTSPQDSPSGVSLGQTIPQLLGCSDLGPPIFLVFSKLLVIRVIIPMHAMYERRDSTYVTPDRSILNLLRFQFPVLIALLSPYVIESYLKHFTTSNSNALAEDGVVF